MLVPGQSGERGGAGLRPQEMRGVAGAGTPGGVAKWSEENVSFSSLPERPARSRGGSALLRAWVQACGLVPWDLPGQSLPAIVSAPCCPHRSAGAEASE